jgi:class 3 adenylate cyclase/tetratricopeptide (TPR) repeat protein
MEGVKMQCPKCQFENREGVDFCEECGAKLELECPNCEAKIPLGRKFCGKCGYALSESKETAPLKESKHDTQIPESPPEETVPTKITAEGERKHVTVLFSDLTGYTAMSERLDPEEVKEITTKIFDEISKIVSKYGGFIEKYAGDAVMALFGADATHEDDPVRAINAAREIHNIVYSLSPKYEERIEQPLSMHSGINTGLVVTGEVNLEKGTHGIVGGTINVAARLSALSNAGDILVTADTYVQTDGYFDFEELEPTKIKGKTEPVRIFKVISQKDQPIKIHRLQGLKAELIGRKVEMSQLADAVQKLKARSASVYTICGTAGTGKSRLIKEFKESLNLDEIQWLEGQAFPFSQNMPYFPLINLLNRAFQIKEDDPSHIIKNKIETGIASLLEEKKDVVPYIGTLFSLSYPEVDEVSPEFWQIQLQKAVQTLLSALARRAPLVICFEDLHWSDPSFLELFRLILSEFREPVLFLCSYRPVISLFTSQQISAMTNSYKEILLQDLSPTESQSMVESLLKTDTIPADLQQIVQEKVEGNPFYLEELINSLIETGALVFHNGVWEITRPITESDIPSTIHGVLSGRLDRLEKETKRILQEASVIGRVFLYSILNRITELKDHINRSLNGLERLDLIKTRVLQPELEYIFKHALTQEVVYNGLLKKERQKIHERIGLVIEQFFKDRLPEFYETLAYHFTRGESTPKAVNYLVKSGEKCIKRYSVEEAHQYYLKAYNTLNEILEKSEDQYALLLDLLIKWAHVFYYRGDFKGMFELFSSHESIANSTSNKSKAGIFYAWLGQSFWAKEEFRVFEKYLLKALQLGEEIQDQKVIGYSCMYLSWNCVELGRFEEAVSFGERAQKVASIIQSDQYLFFNSLAAIGYAYWYRGEKKKAIEVGKILIDYGNKNSNVRSLVMGYFVIGNAYFHEGNFQSAISNYTKALKVSADPLYSQFPRAVLAMNYILAEQTLDAEMELKKVVEFGKKFGVEVIGSPCELFLGVVSIMRGNIRQGFNKINNIRQIFNENGRKPWLAISEHTLGKIYLQLVEKRRPTNLSMIAKNFFFLMRNLPVATKKAEKHIYKAIKLAQEIGAKGILGQAYLDLGILHKIKKRDDKARECLERAIYLLKKTEADVYLKQANEVLDSLM